MNTDRIEKKVVLRAPRARVWRMITDAEEFGSWFGARLVGRFDVGQWIHGKITTPGYEHMDLDMLVERMEPEQLFSYRWHPNAIEPGKDPSAQPMTLVEFTLDEVPEGTALTIVESGFDRVPPAGRAESYHRNESGWEEQTRNLERYVGKP